MKTRSYVDTENDEEDNKKTKIDDNEPELSDVEVSDQEIEISDVDVSDPEDNEESEPENNESESESEDKEESDDEDNEESESEDKEESDELGVLEKARGDESPAEDYEPLVTLCEMIADLDDSKAGNIFLNMLEVYMVFIISFYLFFIISQ
jgi:hypothetical protein